MSSLTVCQLAKFVGKIWWCCSMLTLVAKESELEISSLPCRLQSVQLAEGWSEVVIQQWWEHQSNSRVHHWLKLLEQITAEYWRGWHFRNPAASKQETLPATGEQTWKRTEDSSQLTQFSEAGRDILCYVYSEDNGCQNDVVSVNLEWWLRQLMRTV